MKNINCTNKNYAQVEENYQLKLQFDLNILIPEDDSVRLLSLITEELDYTKLEKAYSLKGRNPVVQPKILFQILVYAYMNDIYSSRKIEIACKRDINFMWLLRGQKCPDHNTIARFRTGKLKGVVDDLFNQTIVKLHSLGQIDYENIFIDGTKIESAANKYTFVWKKSISKFEIKLESKIIKLFEDINLEYSKNFSLSMLDNKLDSLCLVFKFLIDIKDNSNIEFVYGKGKRKSKLQRFYELISDYICKQNKYNIYNANFDGRNSFSKTDIDATFMHLKEDHMRNSQLKPAYNVQIGVEGEYIVGLDISSERSDQLTLIPFLDKLGESLPAKYKNIVADAGYESEENYVYLDRNNQTSYIKPQIYESMKTRKFKNNISKRENMEYNKEEDTYTCFNNKILRMMNTTTRTSKSGYKAIVNIYECESCANCELKEKCTKAKGNKKISISNKFIDFRNNSTSNITTNFGKLARMNRSIQVEGAFGVLKENHNFRRFLTKGKQNVKIEFTLLCFAYNLNKLHTRIQNNKTGVSFYKKEIV